jgi:hypothetical protein
MCKHGKYDPMIGAFGVAGQFSTMPLASSNLVFIQIHYLAYYPKSSVLGSWK